MSEGYVFGKYVCPKCGATVPFFVARSDRSPVVVCPSCRSGIGKNSVPEESIIVDPDLHSMVKSGVSLQTVIEKAKEKGYIPEVVETSEFIEEINETADGEGESVLAEPIDKEEIRKEIEKELKEDEEEEEEETDLVEDLEDEEEETTSIYIPHKPLKKRIRPSSLFNRPKEPCVVLEEVLTEFSLKKEFVMAMIRRCKRSGGLHPVELLHYLITMKSGVKTQGEAQFIAEEYAAALRKEIEKAKQLGVSYPLIGLADMSVLRSTASTPLTSRLLELVPPSGTGGRGYGTMTYESRQPLQQNPSIPPRNEGALLQGIAQLVQALKGGNETGQLLQAFLQMQQQQQQQQQQQMMQMFQLILQMVQQQNQTMVQSLGQGLQELGKSFAESIKEMSKILEKKSKEKNVDPELVYKAARAEAEKDFYQKLLEMQSKTAEGYAKKIEELEKKIYEVVMSASKPAGEFQSDEAKLVATALQQAAVVGNRLVDALDRRQPIKIIVEALPYITQATATPVQRPVERSSETTENEIIKELEELGLVVEESTETVTNKKIATEEGGEE